MTLDSSKITIHMVSSLDGFIAKKDNSVSWMEPSDRYEKGVALTDEDIAIFLKSIDCYVMGSRTYEQALSLGWPYGSVPVFVTTNQDRTTEREKVKFVSGDITKIVNDQLKPNFKNIWLVGGSMLTKEFIRLKLADEVIVSIMPVLLGDGKLFFDYIGKEEKLHLKDVKAYKDGMVELWYEINKEL